MKIHHTPIDKGCNTPSRCHPITQSERDFYKNNTSIAKQMPVKFKNGFELMNIAFNCHVCGNTLPHDRVHGQVRPVNDGLTVIDAAGACLQCKVMTRYLYRVRDNKVIQYPGRRTWVETNLGKSSKREMTAMLLKNLPHELSESLKAGIVGLLFPWPGSILFFIILLYLLANHSHL